VAQPILNRRLLIGNKWLGSVLYFLDSKKRAHLKVTVKTKIGGANLWRLDIASGEKTSLMEPDSEYVSLDISYKYEDSLIEIKQEKSAQKTKRKFVKIPLPVVVYLFTLKIKDWQYCSTVAVQESDIIITTKGETGIVIFFSFPSEDGKAFVDPKYIGKTGRLIPIDLPTSPPRNKLLIGFTEEDLSTQDEDLTFQVPETNQ